MSDYATLVKKAEKFHGHMCPGIVMGTRMAMAGMRELGMDPDEHKRDLIVYVEIDRCATDAIQAITGCSLGHRTMKHKDYGKFAATFVDLGTGKAVRISIKDTPGGGPGSGDMKVAMKTLAALPEEELLKITPVTIDIDEDDKPGLPRRKVNCAICGERIMDGRDLSRGGKPVCKACAEGAYYKEL